MGSWDATCCLSGLSISYNEAVCVWLIIPKSLTEHRFAGNCYPYNMYCPISFMIEGRYDDYGLVNNIREGLSSAHIMELFSRGILELRAGSKHEEMPHVNNITIDDVFAYVERGKVWYNDVKVDMFIARKDLLVENTNNVIRQLGEYFEKLSSGVDGLSRKYNMDDPVEMIEQGMLKYTNMFLTGFNEISTVYLMDKSYKEATIELLTSSTMTDFNKDALLRTMTTNYLLGNLRKCWIAQPSGVGSQHFNHKDIREFYESVLRVCDCTLEGH